jgi:ATP-dependent protease HslVU (ClpYQ) peptidase subunit
MTCIVGIAKEDVVYIGGDRSASDDSVILATRRPKVGIKGEWVYGFSGSYGTGQLIELITLPKVLKNDDPYNLLRLVVVEELKKAYESFGRDLEDNAADWLIGCKGRLFEISSGDWGVIELEESSIGSGNTIALGSLHTTRQFDMATPDMRIQWAIDAAIELSTTCLGPVDIVSL